MNLALIFLILGALLIATGVIVIGTFAFFLLVIGFVLLLIGTIILKLLKGIFKIALIAAIIFLGVMLILKYVPSDYFGVDNYSSDKLYCQTDADCVCSGIDPKDNSCYIGNKVYFDKYISNNYTCPDFCSGIGGNLKISCNSNKCQQVKV